jgi:CRISPR-associated endonuclease/helicase Cas3
MVAPPRSPGAPIAHTRPDGETHGLREHLEGTAARAAAFAASFGSSGAARLAGLWHDLGKYSTAFQAKLQGALDSRVNDDDALAQEAASQRVDHSTAGAVLATHRLSPGLGRAIAFAIAGHHAGLADNAALSERLEKKKAWLDDALRGSPPEDLLAQSPTEVPARLHNAPRSDDGVRRLEFWIRMIFSALCDADYLDTEEFMAPGRTPLRARARATTLGELAGVLREHLDSLRAGAAPTAVNTARAEVRAACAARAADAPGRFTLTAAVLIADGR